MFIHLASEHSSTAEVDAVTRLDWRRIKTISRRHAIVFKRSPHRWFDVAAPAIDSILFGSLAVVLSKSTPGDDTTVPMVLTGLLLFHILFASNLALSTGFLEETWSRSLLNLMVTPLRETEYLLGTALFGLSKVFIGMIFVACTALFFYAFDVTPLAVELIPSALILLFMGWVLALFVIGLVLRFGAGAEVLAWALAFLLWPLSGAFYAVDALPGVARADRPDPPDDPRVQRLAGGGRRRADPVGRDRHRRGGVDRARRRSRCGGCGRCSRCSASGATSPATREPRRDVRLDGREVGGHESQRSGRSISPAS